MNGRKNDDCSKDINREQRERIYEDIQHEESYQPTEDTLDNDDPPSGGSGVPDKDED